MLLTKSFFIEGGWVYVASALVSAVLILLAALRSAPSRNAAVVLLACTLAVGSWFTASYARAIEEGAWHDAGAPPMRVLYERCVASGSPACHVQYPVMGY